MVTVVGSLVLLSITDANPNTPDPDCTVILAQPRSIAVWPAMFQNGCVSCALSPVVYRTSALAPSTAFHGSKRPFRYFAMNSSACP